MYVGTVRKLGAPELHPVYAALLFFLLPLLTGSCFAGSCIDPAALVQSTASITKHFSEEERKDDPALLGIRGTAWFLSPRSIATAAHVAESMNLSDRNWSQIEIQAGESTQQALVRIEQLAGPQDEKIVVLKLQAPFPGARALPMRTEPLALGESVVSLGYPDNHLRFATGRFVRDGEDGKFAGTALFEMYDGDDRLVLDHGASGAPVLDCNGRVVAVVSNIFVKTIPFMSAAIRVSTAWGSPNITAVPITVLQWQPEPE